jgi:uncharacterized membrane protein
MPFGQAVRTERQVGSQTLTIKNEFIWIILIGLILVALIAAGVRGLPSLLPMLRLFLGLAFVLIVPGYTLQAALFPRAEELDGPERLALSFGLSVAVVPPIALVLDALPWGIRLWPIVAAEGLFILACSAVALYRRRRLAEQERFVLALEFDPGDWWAAQDRTNRVLYRILALALLTAAVAATAIIVLPKPGERFTEFYVLGPEGLAEGYPRTAAVGQALEVPVGIVNREGRTAVYLLRIELDDQLLARIGPILLASGQTWEGPVSFVPSVAGRDLRLEFLLYKDGGDVPYRSLLLWLDEVTE